RAEADTAEPPEGTHRLPLPELPPPTHHSAAQTRQTAPFPHRIPSENSGESPSVPLVSSIFHSFSISSAFSLTKCRRSGSETPLSILGYSGHIQVKSAPERE